MNLADLAKEFRKGVLLALSLVVIEHVAWIVEPAVFGQAIDAIIGRVTRDGPSVRTLDVFPLFLWVAVFAVNSGVGVVRRVVDERIYLRIYSEIATQIATEGKLKSYGASKTTALAQMSEQFISFLQYRLPEIIDQVVSIGGAVIALATYDWQLSVVCLTIVLPLALITRVYTRRVSALQRDYHDNYEVTFDVFARQNIGDVKTYFERATMLKQRIANWGALNFGVMRMALLIIFLAVLYISIDLDKFSTGNIYAIVAYIWTFITTSEYIPELMESWTSLRDVLRRVRGATI